MKLNVTLPHFNAKNKCMDHASLHDDNNAFTVSEGEVYDEILTGSKGYFANQTHLTTYPYDNKCILMQVIFSIKI